jgi:CIC family chloride channel protein
VDVTDPDAAAHRADAKAERTRRLTTALRLWRLHVWRFRLRFVPTEGQRLFALTLGIGVLCGLVAVLFHLSIEAAERALIERAMSAPGRAWIPWTLVTPTLGGLLCGALIQYVVPNARGSGIPQVKTAFALRDHPMRLRDSVGKFLLGSLQIGAGASLGREGPTVQICAGVASALGRAAGVSPRSLRRLLPVGAAAGIAAAFNAPIAAVTFTVEEVVGDLDRTVLSGAIVAAALAAVIERGVLGENAVLQVPRGYHLQHASSLVTFAMLGVAASGVSVLFTDSLLSLRARFREMRALPAWARPGVGGLVTGVLAVAALAGMQSRGVTGGGYQTLSEALAGRLAVETMVALCALKLVATVASYSSGGAGGIFAPALFIGAMLGGAFGGLDILLFDHRGDPIGAFALVGMGAVFAGIVRAPMTSVLIIIEMTDGYSLILPLMIANMSSYLIARALRPRPIYEALLEQDGVHLPARVVADALEGICVRDVLARPDPLVTFAPTSTAGELARARGPQEVFPVLDASGALAGVVTGEEARLLDAEPGLERLVNAADVMRAPVSVGLGDDLHVALRAMHRSGLARLPVLDDEGRVVGLVDEAAIAKAYLREQSAQGE